METNGIAELREWPEDSKICTALLWCICLSVQRASVQWFQSWGILHRKGTTMVRGEATSVYMETVSGGPRGSVKCFKLSQILVHDYFWLSAFFLSFLSFLSCLSLSPGCHLLFFLFFRFANLCHVFRYRNSDHLWIKVRHRLSGYRYNVGDWHGRVGGMMIAYSHVVHLDMWHRITSHILRKQMAE